MTAIILTRLGRIYYKHFNVTRQNTISCPKNSGGKTQSAALKRIMIYLYRTRMCIYTIYFGNYSSQSAILKSVIVASKVESFLRFTSRSKSPLLSLTTKVCEIPEFSSLPSK